MSLNTAMNAVIASIEGRMDLVKEIFRSPQSDVKSIPQVAARLQKAIDTNKAKGIRHALVESLSIQPPEKDKDRKVIDRESFFAGVTAVEAHMERVAQKLESPWEDDND